MHTCSLFQALMLTKHKRSESCCHLKWGQWELFYNSWDIYNLIHTTSISLNRKKFRNQELQLFSKTFSDGKLSFWPLFSISNDLTTLLQSQCPDHLSNLTLQYQSPQVPREGSIEFYFESIHEHCAVEKRKLLQKTFNKLFAIWLAKCL